jgi:hypothetical protein
MKSGMKAPRSLRDKFHSHRAEKAQEKGSRSSDEPLAGESTLLSPDVVVTPCLRSEDPDTLVHQHPSLAREQTIDQGRAVRDLAVLFDSDHAARLHSIQDALPGTCEWLKRHPKVELWLKSRHSTCLWLTAGPARGKSTIAKYVAFQLLEKSQAEYATCFCFIDDRTRSSACRVLCTLLFQLFQQRPHLLKHFQSVFDKEGPSLASRFESLWEIWFRSVSDPAARQLVCIIDAMDGLDGNDRQRLTRRFLEFVGRDDVSGVKLFVTSRPDEMLQARLDYGRGSRERVGHLNCEESLESEALLKAPDLYLDKILQDFNSKGQRIRLEDSDVLESLLTELRLPRPPPYLVLRTMVEGLLRDIDDGNSISRLIARIRSLPEDLEAFYERTLHESLDPGLTKQILLILLAASRGLTSVELQVALCLGGDNSEIRSYEDLKSDLSLTPKSIDAFENHVRELCGSLIQILGPAEIGRLWQGSVSTRSLHQSATSVSRRLLPTQNEFSQGIICLSHETARIFLVSKESTGFPRSKAFPLPEAHSVLARASIRFLQLFQHHRLEKEQSAFPPSIAPLWAHSYFEYSVENWITHLKAADMQTPGLVELGLSTCNADFITFLQPTVGVCCPPSPGSAPIIAAAFWTLRSLIPQDKASINAKDENSGMTALMIAAQSGASDIVEELCNNPSLQIDLQNANGDSALIIALANGHDEIAKLLLQREADPRIQNRQGITALMSACSRGSEMIVETLTTSGEVDINTRNVDGGSALTVAIEGGNVAIFRMLLKSPDINVRIVSHGGISQGMNPLMMCAYRGWANEIHLLLQRHDIDTRDPDTRHFVELLGKLPRYREVCSVLKSRVQALSDDMRAEHGTWLRERMSFREYSWIWFVAVKYFDDKGPLTASTA